MRKPIEPREMPTTANCTKIIAREVNMAIASTTYLEQSENLFWHVVYSKNDRQLWFVFHSFLSTRFASDQQHRASDHNSGRDSARWRTAYSLPSARAGLLHYFQTAIPKRTNSSSRRMRL